MFKRWISRGSTGTIEDAQRIMGERRVAHAQNIFPSCTAF